LNHNKNNSPFYSRAPKKLVFSISNKPQKIYVGALLKNGEENKEGNKQYG